MSKARLVITALTVQGLTVTEVVDRYAVSRSWTYELLARYRGKGETAFEPRPRTPKTRPNATPQHVIDLILRLRKQLSEAGLDAGAETIAWHLTRHHATDLAGAQVPSRATIHRTLARHAAVVPEPAKRPKASYIR